MEPLFGQYPRLGAFLGAFLPDSRPERREFTCENADRLIACLLLVLDALFKAENLARRKNLRLAPGRTYFPDSLPLLLDNLVAYLQEFNQKLEEKDRRALFADYRFWIENLFKLCDQKIGGAVAASKRVSPKNLFGPQEALHDELIYGNAAVNFSLFPFAVVQEGGVLFLARLDADGALYRGLAGPDGARLAPDGLWPKVAEFLLANFCFTELERVERLLPAGEEGGLGKWRQVEAAQREQQLQRYAESQQLLDELAFEELNMPLAYLLQVRNLAELGRGPEMKRLLQKFLLFYPFYAAGHEWMGDVYAREDNPELALNFYEKALLIAQSRGLGEKIKKARDLLDKGRGKPEAQKNDAFFDITDAVIQNEQRIIGRHKELRQMIEILISGSKRNLLLIGERGVGKTALVRLLAQKIIFGEVPPALREKRIKEINFVALLTGSKYRGQFEEKVLKLLQEFRTQNAILVLEDMHLMMSTGAARGTSLDLVNILKNFLRDNSIQVIATTDYEEYKNTIEKDNSLLGHFQKIVVNELSLEGTRRVLKDIVAQVLAADSLHVSGAIIDDIVESAKRDIRDRKLPDSAIMLLERCIAKVKLKNVAAGAPLTVEETDVLEVLADIGNLPETTVSISLKSRLASLRENLLKRIVGQDEAVAKMVSSVIASKLGYDVKKNRPDGVFMFIGPTGVGKTETAIALSEALYGSQDYLIRIDMSEYMEKFTYSRFVGAAPGYVGYYDANQLTDKVRLNPYSVILLDEIEKADAQLLNIFLQVFDAGRLTDARGNVIDFSKTTIVMTSNIGTALFAKGSLGYKSSPEGTQVSRATLIKALKKYFSPEFLNRIDEIIVFAATWKSRARSWSWARTYWLTSPPAAIRWNTGRATSTAC